MTREEILYLLPYLFSLVLSLGITIYAWEHRRVQGAGAYAILTSAQTLIILGFILELLSPDLSGKLIWDKIQWILFAAASIAIPYFAVQYTEYKIQHPKILWGLVSIIPAILTLGVIADPLFHLVYPNPSLDQTFVFGELQYDFTWFIYAFAAYGYLTVTIALILLARRVVRPHQLYRAQVTAVIIGLLFPIFGTFLGILGVQIASLRDTTPITSAIGNLIITWSIFRYRWLNIVHIAREKVIENMADLILVLDAQDRIVDINPSALRLLNLKSNQAIGESAEPIFSESPILLEKFRQPANASHEIIVEENGKYYHYDVKSTLLHDRRGEFQGRIFVARDITPYAELQWKLKELNEELEQKVQKRTEELAQSYDTTLEGWAKALELRDKETEGHSRRVTELTLRLAQAIGIPAADLEHIRRGAILHDIGKMAISDEILRKTGPLSDAEQEIVLQHPAIAYQLLSRISYLQKALDIPYCHHEKWNGSGYPRGLKGAQIPLAARIFAVVDVWDAIQSDRPYKKAWTRDRAIEYLREQAGEYFDPEVVGAFLALIEKGEI
ncbi:MAG: HD domain-containing protein [Chloroflexi bacterium]|nr:HD domain-containing protein [Chloroflexota bacterium]